jgi:hypothetical protein
MDNYTLAGREIGVDLFQGCCHFSFKIRNSAISDRKRFECHALRPRRLSTPWTINPIKLFPHALRVRLYHDLTRKRVNIHSTLAKQMDTMIPIDYSSVRSRFPAIPLAGR